MIVATKKCDYCHKKKGVIVAKNSVYWYTMMMNVATKSVVYCHKKKGVIVAKK